METNNQAQWKSKIIEWVNGSENNYNRLKVLK